MVMKHLAMNTGCITSPVLLEHIRRAIAPHASARPASKLRSKAWPCEAPGLDIDPALCDTLPDNYIDNDDGTQAIK